MDYKDLKLSQKDDEDPVLDSEEDATPKRSEKKGKRKIKIEFIEDKSRRHITFSKRKLGIMKKAWELATLTGTQVLLLVASETGHVYTYATPKFQPLITKSEGKNLIRSCLNSPDTIITQSTLPTNENITEHYSPNGEHNLSPNYRNYARIYENTNKNNNLMNNSNLKIKGNVNSPTGNQQVHPKLNEVRDIPPASIHIPCLYNNPQQQDNQDILINADLYNRDIRKQQVPLAHFMSPSRFSPIVSLRHPTQQNGYPFAALNRSEEGQDGGNI